MNSRALKVNCFGELSPLFEQPVNGDFDSAAATVTLQDGVHVISLPAYEPNCITELEVDANVLLMQPQIDVVPHEIADIPLNATDEEILKYLEAGAQAQKAPPKPASPLKFVPLPLAAAAAVKKKKKEPPVKCMNCGLLFTLKTHKEHICDYDENHKLIVPNTSAAPEKLVPSVAKPVATAPVVSSPPTDPTPREHPCVRLLCENQIRIRRFLKEELRYDATKTTAVATKGSQDAVPAKECSKKYSNVCHMCDRSFVHPSGLVRHMEKHALDLIPAKAESSRGGLAAQQLTANTLRVMIGCPLCGRVFLEPDSAHRHYCGQHFAEDSRASLEMNRDKPFDIEYESFVNGTVAMLHEEFSLYQSNGQDAHPLQPQLKILMMNCVLQCEFCELVFFEVSFLFMHAACHRAVRRFECVSCGIHVKTSKEISTHWQTECVAMREDFKLHNANVLRYFVCNVCEEKFQGLELLHEHRYLKYHFFPRFNESLTELQLPCEYCDAVSLSALECVEHFGEKHSKKYKRKKPDGLVPMPNAFKSRQYLCDICGKSYTQSSHLWQHLRFHQGVKPFACKEPGCDRKFTIRPDLNDHIRKCHTGERPYHCLICGKRFLTGSVFYQHRLIHRGERRYECDQCHKRFYRADALKNHQRIHTGEKPFGCLYCTKHFRQRGDRDKHIRARHANLNENTRLMMQMQKLKLETEAVAVEALRRGDIGVGLPERRDTEIVQRVTQNAELLMLGDKTLAQNFRISLHGITE